MDVYLRQLQAADVGQVAEIEREAFAPLVLGTPFKREVNNRYARYLVACCREESEDTDHSAPGPPSGNGSLWGRVVRGMQEVVSRGQVDGAGRGYIAGYVGVWFQGNEAHITEIAVREEMRGNGIGELLLIGSVRAAIENGSSLMTLEARVSNLVAQRLYEKYGFRSSGLRKGYYSDNREDAVIMTTGPIHSAEYQSQFRSLQETYLARWREISIQG